MSFETEKEKYISILLENIEENKKDKSRKGFVDKDILDLVNLINSLDCYYTTSSCAGRILIFGVPLTGIKKDAIWFLATHDFVKDIDINDDIFTKIKESKNITHIKQEAAILHVCAKDLDSAQKIVDIAKFIGFKRSGIMATKKRIMVELMSTERLDVPIYDGKKLFLNQEYLDFTINQANKSLKRTRDKINKFELKIKEEFNLKN